jgi:DNA-binding transcriptional LysR family regulator
VKAGRLQIILAEFEPDPLPVHLLHAAGRMARASLRAFIDFAAQRLRAEPLLR